MPAESVRLQWKSTGLAPILSRLDSHIVLDYEIDYTDKKLHSMLLKQWNAVIPAWKADLF